MRRRMQAAAVVLALGAAGCAWSAAQLGLGGEDAPAAPAAATPAGPVPAWEEAPPPPRTGPVVPADRLHRATLDNGVEVVVLEDPALPRVALGLVVPRGSAWVPVGDAGLAAYTVELMRRGAGERGALAFARAVDALGASLATSTDWDASSVSASGLSRDFDALAGLVADVVLRPRFEEAEAARLRAQRLASLERSRDDPSTVARWNLAQALFPGHPYGLPEEGTPETVTGFDPDRAREAHAALFRPDGAIFFASGDVTPEAAVARARELFGAWDPPPAWAASAREAGYGAAGPPPAPGERRVVIVDRPDLRQATLLLGHEGFPRTDPERIPAQLMNIVLGGGGFSSRIVSRVREAAGLAYYAYSGFGMRRHGGLFVAATGTRVPEAGRALGLLLDEIEAMRTARPPSAEEIAHARSLSAGRFALGLETSDAIVGALVDLDVYGLPRDSLDTYRRRVAGTSDEAVRAAARATLHPQRAAIVAVGPAEALRPQLEPFGPVEVVQP